MKAGEASATPIAAARARAAHLTRYAGPNVHENTFALRLTGDTLEELQEMWRPSVAAQRVAAYFAMRHRFSEERLLVALERGVCQVVLLGALRHPEIVRNRSNGSVPMMRCQPTNSLSSSTPVPVPWHAGNHGSRTSNLRKWLGAC